MVEGKADINALNIRQQTPLAEYIHTKRNNKLPLNNELLRSFFSHGARIKSHELTSATEEVVKTCNLLFTVIDKEDAFGESHDTIIAMATLFKERFVLAKKYYRESLLIFNRLNKDRTQKIPKPDHTDNSYYGCLRKKIPFIDIKDSINDQQMAKKEEMYQDFPYNYREVISYRYIDSLMSPLDKVKNTRYNKALCAMLSVEFWDRSLKACVEDLDSIIEKALIDKEESKKQL